LTDIVGRTIGEPLAAFELVAKVVAIIVIAGHGTFKKESLLAFSFYKTLQFGWLAKQQQQVLLVFYVELN
jgi:hypothetical protein